MDRISCARGRSVVATRSNNMRKTAQSICSAVLLLVVSKAQTSRLPQYRAVEAYEIRPGILMMPKYSADGQICEAGLEKMHYSFEKISLSSGLSRKEIDQIADELAPTNERGPKISGQADMITEDGVGRETILEYKNVSIQIYGGTHSCNGGDVVAVIRWKNHKCR